MSAPASPPRTLWGRLCRWIGHRKRAFAASDYMVTVMPDGGFDRRIDMECPRCGHVRQRWLFSRAWCVGPVVKS